MTISFIRTLIIYVVIVVAIRFMGKRQISELQTSELVVTLLISDLAVIPMQNTSQPLTSGFIPIATLVICEIIISSIMLKNSNFRKFICGSPIVVINNGKVDQIQMKRLRITIEDLFEQLRQADVFNISDVAFAIVETNGKMSVIKKPEAEPPKASDFGMTIPNKGIDVVVVSDGEISDFSLSICNLTTDWVYKTLDSENVEIKDVFIMTANKSKEFNIIKKE